VRLVYFIVPHVQLLFHGLRACYLIKGNLNKDRNYCATENAYSIYSMSMTTGLLVLV